MFEFIKKVFVSSDFLPHAHCYLGNTAVIRLHVISDLFITLAYYSIPIILIYFIRKRQDIPFRGLFFMFGAFILACGTTHLMEIWTLWFPAYWLSGVIKACTAILSVTTALILIPTTPKALALRSPSELEAANQELEKQILKRTLIEQELQKTQEELEKRVNERTLELFQANQELKKEISERKKFELALEFKTQELERSNKELEHFAYITSHDLQEPLYVISGFTDTLKEQCGSKLDKEGLFLLGRIQKASHRMELLIRDVLQFARVNIQQKPFEEVDLNSVIQEIIAELDLRIKDTHTQIKVEKLPVLYANKNQMIQLFQNLIVNSIKFRNKDISPKITIKTFGTEGNFVDIQVKDNGIGFEQEYSNEILEPFKRLHTQEEYEGSGLGLAICQKIVSRHGGKISASSSPHQGALFVVTLPLRKGTAT